MLNELVNETVCPLSEVPKAIKKITGGKPHISTVWRWTQKGVSGIILETFFVTGKRWTSQEAIQRFITNTSNAKNGQSKKLRLVSGETSELHERAKREGI